MRERRKLQRKHFSITSLQIQRLDRLAKATNQSLSELARRAFDDFLDGREDSLGLSPMLADEGKSPNGRL